jgi:hypothetical protein
LLERKNFILVEMHGKTTIKMSALVFIDIKPTVLIIIE